MRDSDFQQYLSLQGSWNPSFGVYTHVYDAWEPIKHNFMYTHGFVLVWAMILQEKGEKMLKIDIFCGIRDCESVYPPKTYEQHVCVSVQKINIR